MTNARSAARARLQTLLAPEVLDTLERLIDEHIAMELSRLESAAARAASPYATVAEAAEYLRSTKQRVYDLLSAQRLTRHHDGRRVLILWAELEAHLSTGPRSVAHALPRASQRRTESGFGR
jgi:excisionase family DNA binding protein